MIMGCFMPVTSTFTCVPPTSITRIRRLFFISPFSHTPERHSSVIVCAKELVTKRASTGRRVSGGIAGHYGLSPLCGSENRSPGFRDRGVQPGCKHGKSGCGAVPAQLVHIVEELYVGPERGERAKQKCVVPLTGESIGESARVGHVYMPVSPIH